MLLSNGRHEFESLETADGGEIERETGVGGG